MTKLHRTARTAPTPADLFDPASGPTPAELAAIEAEMPLLQAELNVLDAEIAILTNSHGASELDYRRLRRARNEVLRQAAALGANGGCEGAPDATTTPVVPMRASRRRFARWAA